MRLLRVLPILALCLTGCKREAVSNFTVTLTNISQRGDLETSQGDHDIVLAPGLVVVHEAGFKVFEAGGEADAGLEAVAEDGDPSRLMSDLEEESRVSEVAVIAAVDGVTYGDAPITPAGQASAEVQVTDAERVTVLLMFGESNDVVVASLDNAVFNKDGSALATDLAGTIALYDMGTEQNEEPGLGPNQPARQSAPNTGSDESAMITLIEGKDAKGYTYPAPDDFVTIMVEP